MTQYLLSVYGVDGAPEPSPEQMERVYKDVDALNEATVACAAPVEVRPFQEEPEA